MCADVGVSPCRPSDIELPIGTDGITSLDFVPSADRNILFVGTANGRVRILDCSKSVCETLYQKRWHKTIRCLSTNPFSSTCITASKQCCIKVHDIETNERTAVFRKMEDSAPYSALIVVSDHRWITGDDNGFVKMWDDRQKGGHCFTIKPPVDDYVEDLAGINDFAVGTDPQGTLLAAVDNGCLVSYNIRRRRLDLVSEPLGYSARSVSCIKDGKKVILGTDEGVLLTYNWNEFGSVCDRFPVRTSRSRVDQVVGVKYYEDAGFPSVEKIAKITEDIVVVATDDGALSPMNILPNRMLDCLGWHTSEDLGGGDCMTLAVSPDRQLVASGLPLAPSIKFWPVGHLQSEASEEIKLLSLPKKRRLTGKLASTKSAKSKTTSRCSDQDRTDFLSGLISPADESDEETGSTDDSSDGSE
uniref:WD_REPEATS_REGION domain-containing protein n=1 Tax=Mesocestoides corti TaxID=53468 RepID=A0A5K3ETI5_MESCO